MGTEKGAGPFLDSHLPSQPSPISINLPCVPFFPQQRAKKEESTATQHTPATMEMWKGGTCTVDSHSLKHTTFIFFTLPQISGSGKSKIYLSRKFAIFHRQNERKLCILYSGVLRMMRGPELPAGTEPAGPEKRPSVNGQGRRRPGRKGRQKQGDCQNA